MGKGRREASSPSSDEKMICPDVAVQYAGPGGSIQVAIVQHKEKASSPASLNKRALP